MGDIADLVLDGTLCEGCGVLLGTEGPGHPQRCEGCEGDLEEYMSDAVVEFPEWLEIFLDDARDAVVNNSPLEEPLNVETRELTLDDDEGHPGPPSYEVRIFPNLILSEGRLVPPCMHVNVVRLADLFEALRGIEWHPCTGSIAISGFMNGHELLLEIFDDVPEPDEDDDEPDEAARDDHGSN